MSMFTEVEKMNVIRTNEEKLTLSRENWPKNYSWILDEQAKLRQGTDALREQIDNFIPDMCKRAEIRLEMSSLDPKPLPETSAGMVGWLAAKPEFRLEKYPNQRPTIPIKAPINYS